MKKSVILCKNCPVCNKDFVKSRSKSSSGWKKQKYCSYECTYEKNGIKPPKSYIDYLMKSEYTPLFKWYSKRKFEIETKKYYHASDQ